MRFWDSSAVVPLVVREPTTAACRAELRVDPAQKVSRLTRIEATHALERKLRDGVISRADLRISERALATLASRWEAMELTEDVETDAIALLGRHPLRAADAIQLASARLAAGGRPRGRVFVTRDELLATAAQREGFRVIVPRI